MKRGGKAEFFEAKLTDGDAHMRLVGFSAGQRKRLASFQDRLEAVTIENCQVKKSRQSDELEVLLRSASRLQSSPKKFNIGDITKLTTSEITLRDLSTRNTFNKVSVPAKVIRVDDPVKVSGNLTKQDIVVADSTSAAKLTVWEANVGCVTEGESYRFVNLVVRSYQHSKYLSLPKDSGHIEKIEDIGDVVEDDLAEDSVTVYGAEVAGVIALGSYMSCLQCKAKENQQRTNWAAARSAKCSSSFFTVDLS